MKELAIGLLALVAIFLGGTLLGVALNTRIGTVIGGVLALLALAYLTGSCLTCSAGMCGG